MNSIEAFPLKVWFARTDAHFVKVRLKHLQVLFEAWFLEEIIINLTPLYKASFAEFCDN